MQIYAVASYHNKMECSPTGKLKSGVPPTTMKANTMNLTPLTIREMASNPESLMVGKMILEDASRRSANNSELDKLTDDLDKMQQEIDKIKNMFKIKVSKSTYSAPAEIFSRLARTATVPDVKTVISAAQHKIFVLKSVLRTCEKQRSNKIRAVIAQLEKSIHRANSKINALIGEEQKQWQQKNAEKLEQYRKAEQIKLELDRQKAMRRFRETAQINESKGWFYYPEDLIGGKNLAVPDNSEPQINTDTPAGSDNMANICQTIDVLL